MKGKNEIQKIGVTEARKIKTMEWGAEKGQTGTKKEKRQWSKSKNWRKNQIKQDAKENNRKIMKS